MQLHDWIKSKGYDFVPVLDGKTRRFNPSGKSGDDAGWYIGSQELLPSGKTRTTLTLGDWRTDERHYYPEKNGEAWSEEDKCYYAEQQRRSSQKHEEEKTIRWEKAAKDAKEIIASSTRTRSHPYLERKKLDILGIDFTTWDIYVNREERLVIPLYQAEGELCGAQLIDPQGAKKFIPGTKAVGAFFKIPGSNSSTIAVCEGFATATTIRRATDFDTLTAFNCGNLGAVVDKIARLYPGRQIIVCGDDDSHTQGNPGKTKAQLTGRNCVFPYFKDGFGGTDWNDLLCLEGLDEVKRQIESGIRGTKNSGTNSPRDESRGSDPTTTEINGADRNTGNNHQVGQRSEAVESKAEDAKEKASEEYLICLGHNGNDYFYTSSSNKQIQSVSRTGHSWQALSDLMPRTYWIEHYPIYSSKGVRSIGWEWAACSIMDECRKKGIFSFKKVRGNGAWLDKEKLLVHLGDRIWSSDKVYELNGLKTDYIYKLGPKLPDINLIPATVSECSTLTTACESINWKETQSGKILAAWCAVSRISGAMPWRSHLWLTGPAGSGKTTVLEEVIQKMIGKFGLYVTSNTTEAGIRQKLGAHSYPVIFDEAETTNLKSGGRIQGILELARQASSDTEARIVKGTADGKSHNYKINSAFLLSSIRTNLREEADKTRFCVLELNRNIPEEWREIKKNIMAITPELCDKIFHRMIARFDDLISVRERFEDCIAKIHQRRTGQQYSSLCAAYWFLKSEGIPSQKDIEQIILEFGLYQQHDEVSFETDEIECIETLLETKTNFTDWLDDKNIRCTVKEFIKLTFDSMHLDSSKKHYLKELNMIGIDIVDNSVWIAAKNPELQKLMRDTKWGDGNWAKSISRIHGAKTERNRINGSQKRGVIIPRDRMGL